MLIKTVNQFWNHIHAGSWIEIFHIPTLHLFIIRFSFFSPQGGQNRENRWNHHPQPIVALGWFNSPTVVWTHQETFLVQNRQSWSQTDGQWWSDCRLFAHDIQELCTSIYFHEIAAPQVHKPFQSRLNFSMIEEVYQTWEIVFHWDIETPRRE